MSDERFDIDDILNEVKTARTKKNGDTSPSGKQQRDVSDTEVPNIPDLSVTDVLNSIPLHGARQLSENEMNERRNREISAAFNNLENRRPSQRQPERSARQLTDEESSIRIAKDISNASDVKIWEKASRAEIVEDDVKPYVVKPSASGDTYEFHKEGDLATTDTMQMNRQQKIADINEALLKLDSESEDPHDILDSLNPMETRSKAQDIISSSDEETDTLAVAGNDLKRIAAKGAEHVKEYKPSVTRHKEEPSEAELFSGISKSSVHVGSTMVEALNKKIREQKEQESKETSEPEKTEKTEENAFVLEDDPAEKVRRAAELAEKKRRRIAKFILETGDDDTEEFESPEDEEDIDEEEEEAVDLDDEDVIRDRLARSNTGLRSRLVILIVLFAVTLFVGIVNRFSIDVGSLGKIIYLKFAPNNYLYTHLTIGILSFTACSSVISNGFSRLFKLRPDGDTLCAFAHCAAIVAIVPYLSAGEYIQRGRSQVYLMVSLAALIFNTISKLFTVKTAQKNFDQIFNSDKAKYFISRCDGSGAEHLAKGAVNGKPIAVSMRKTEMLCDFIVSTYCEDLSDIISRKLVPITILAALVGGTAGFFSLNRDTFIMMNRVSWAVTVLSAVFAIGAAFAGSLTITLPMYAAARKNMQRGSVILGYQSAAELSETNAVLVEAKTLFPANAVKINNICGYDKPHSRCEGKVNIDEAIIFAASLAMASNSVLADAFFGMLNFKSELLKPVSGCVYENNLGVMGWIDRRRVLLGSRKHMTSHEITVPNLKKENAANINNDEVIYLAVGGEVCLLFFVELTADREIHRSVRQLAANDISIVIKAVDGLITPAVITDLFRIDEETLKILPFELHDTFTDNTKFVSSGSAALACDGTFSSLSDTIIAARSIKSSAVLANTIQTIGIGLGILIAIVFGLFANYDMLNLFNVFLYNIAIGLICLLPVLFKKR